MDYSGDVAQAAERAEQAHRGVTVRYVIPKEGAQIGFDMLAIPADAPHKALALQFINFLLQPDVMAGITNAVRYPNAVPASKPMIRPELLANPAVYPTPADDGAHVPYRPGAARRGTRADPHVGTASRRAVSEQRQGHEHGCSRPALGRSSIASSHRFRPNRPLRRHVALHRLDLIVATAANCSCCWALPVPARPPCCARSPASCSPTPGTSCSTAPSLPALPPHRRPVNTMFQSYALFPHMSVAANIGFGLRQQRRPRAEIAARVAEMLALVRLEGFAARRPHQLSGGQQQRVALARCLAPNPRLLLLDEPLSALDRNLRVETRGELARLQKRLGTSFILVTHDQEEALTIGRPHRRDAGRPPGAGRLRRPRFMNARDSRFVAEFLGAANILPAIVRHDGLLLPELGVTVRAATSAVPGPALLALRPERLRIGRTDAPNRLAGVVAERSYAGETLTHSVRLSPMGRCCA